MIKNNPAHSASSLRKILFAYFVVALFVFTLFLLIFSANITYRYIKSSEEQDLRYAVETKSIAIQEWLKREMLWNETPIFDL